MLFTKMLKRKAKVLAEDARMAVRRHNGMVQLTFRDDKGQTYSVALHGDEIRRLDIECAKALGEQRQRK